MIWEGVILDGEYSWKCTKNLTVICPVALYAIIYSKCWLDMSCSFHFIAPIPLHFDRILYVPLLKPGKSLYFVSYKTSLFICIFIFNFSVSVHLIGCLESVQFVIFHLMSKIFRYSYHYVTYSTFPTNLEKFSSIQNQVWL